MEHADEALPARTPARASGDRFVHLLDMPSENMLLAEMGKRVTPGRFAKLRAPIRVQGEFSHGRSHRFGLARAAHQPAGAPAARLRAPRAHVPEPAEIPAVAALVPAS